MNSQQYYLGTIEGSPIIAPQFDEGILNKRLKAPTLRSCKYKPEAFTKSMGKYRAYLQKFGICILLVVKFYMDHIKNARFEFHLPRRFSTTNLHGVLSGGFYLDEVKVPKYENGNKTFELKKLKRAKHNHYSDEVNFITEKFLILENKASLHNGPALWKLRELDLDDIILVEVFNLVDEYVNELNQVIQIFHDARFQEETKLSFMFLSDGDLDFLVDVIKIWVR